LNTIIVTIWALDRARSWFWTVSVLKLILLYILIPVAIRTPAHFNTFSAVNIAGATYWGYKAWDDPERRMGRLKNVGGPDSQNENEAAAHLLTVIPFVAVYALSVKRRALQGLLAVCGAFIVNVFILCNSRGATLGLLMMGCAAIVFAGKGRRLKLIGVTVGALLALFVLADHRFIERQQTTIEHRDASAQGRLESWKAGVEVIRDYPMGGGGRAFHILSPRYIPGIVERHDGEERSVHSTYLQLGAEWGIQGVILWMGFLAATMLMLWKARTRAKGEPWFFYRFMAIELSLIGTLVYAVFGNRLYGESLYWMCALAVALQRMHATAVAGESAVVREPTAGVALNTQPAVGNI
jgi:putative inorganic carbon (hco3(-)) transporter